MATRETPSKGGKPDKLIRDALMIAVRRVNENDPQGRQNLAVAAEKVVEMACDGDMAAFREIADRLDGKAHQSITSTVKDARTATDAELMAIIDAEDSGGDAIEPQAGSALTH